MGGAGMLCRGNDMQTRGSLPLAAAALLALATTAHTADLTTAEPVDYVKVCDAFGAGFYYSPGTDTCIKVGGYVHFGTSFGGTDFGAYNPDFHQSSWDNFYTEVSLKLTASSATEFGNLTGFIDMRVVTGNIGGFSESLTQAENAATKTAYLDTAWLSLGPLKAGYFTSLFDFGRGYTDTGGFGSDSSTDHIELSYALGPLGLALSVEDQRDRGSPGNLGGLASSTGVAYSVIDPVTGQAIPYVSTVYAQGGADNIPNVIAAVTYASGIFSTKVAAAYTDMALDRTGAGTLADPYTFDGQAGWAVGGNIAFQLDAVSPGDRLFFSAAYGDNANSFTGISGGTSVAGLSGFAALGDADVAPGTSWSAMASYKHAWTPRIWSAVTGSYADYEGADWYAAEGLTAWRAVASTGWTPVKGLDVMLDGSYSSVDGSGSVPDGDAWAVNLWIERSW